MPVTIDSTRFGVLEVADEAVIEFPHGLIGLEGSRYALIAREESEPFAWLHSLDEPSLALPVVGPRAFFPDFEIELSSAEAARVGLPPDAEADVFVTVRAAAELADFRANTRAPIVILDGRGHQVINEAAGSAVSAPLFEESPVERVA